MASIKVFMKNEDKPKKIVGIPDVPKDKSKKLSKSDGTKLFFINKDYGIKQGFMHKMNFKTLHPIDPKMCEIKIKINRI